MKNLYQRLLTFFIGGTSVVILIIFSERYLGFALLLVTILSAVELRIFFKQIDGWKTPSILQTALLSSTCPLAAMLYVWNILPAVFVLLVPMLVFLVAFSAHTFSKTKSDIAVTIHNVVGRVFLIIYPGFFIMYVILLGTLEHPRIILLSYTLAVYMNDGNAYLSGKLFGNKKNTLVAVSPKKTLEGFIGGLFATFVIIISTMVVFPEIFPGANIVNISVFSFLVGISAIIGDLFASALKRSANIKESGSVIPGRGGMLDSIDSIAFAAPVFYYAYLFLFTS